MGDRENVVAREVEVPGLIDDRLHGGEQLRGFEADLRQLGGGVDLLPEARHVLRGAAGLDPETLYPLFHGKDALQPGAEREAAADRADPSDAAPELAGGAAGEGELAPEPPGQPGEPADGLLAVPPGPPEGQAEPVGLLGEAAGGERSPGGVPPHQRAAAGGLHQPAMEAGHRSPGGLGAAAERPGRELEGDAYAVIGIGHGSASRSRQWGRP